MEQLTNAASLRIQAGRFSEAAAKLIEAAEILDGTSTNGSDHSVGRKPAGKRQTNKTTGKAAKRLMQLRDFLSTNGPMRRAAAMKDAGIPSGTVAYLLKEENGFTKGVDGLWSYKKGGEA